LSHLDRKQLGRIIERCGRVREQGKQPVGHGDGGDQRVHLSPVSRAVIVSRLFGRQTPVQPTLEAGLAADQYGGMNHGSEWTRRIYRKEEEFLEDWYETVDAVLLLLGGAWRPNYTIGVREGLVGQRRGAVRHRAGHRTGRARR